MRSAGAASTCTSSTRAWRRRCASCARVPGASEALALEIGRFVSALRGRRLVRSPGVAESIDWARALTRLHLDRLDPEVVLATLGCIVKDRHDLRDLGADEVGRLVAEARAEEAPAP
jgi:hypothetical protein